MGLVTSQYMIPPTIRQCMQCSRTDPDGYLHVHEPTVAMPCNSAFCITLTAPQAYTDLLPS
eukprot:1157872-Pelagomonas_calceolata.AAC.9